MLADRVSGMQRYPKQPLGSWGGRNRTNTFGGESPLVTTLVISQENSLFLV